MIKAFKDEVEQLRIICLGTNHMTLSERAREITDQEKKLFNMYKDVLSDDIETLLTNWDDSIKYLNEHLNEIHRTQDSEEYHLKLLNRQLINEYNAKVKENLELIKHPLTMYFLVNKLKEHNELLTEQIKELEEQG